MHCKKTAPKVACYVSNYSTTGDPESPYEDAIHLAEASPRFPVATVAMEYDPDLRANAVRFYVYQADLPNNDGTLFKNPALDSEGRKYTPWLCMACHGGAYNNHNVEYASFLPFDVPTYKQDQDSASNYSDLNQRDDFRKLNALVLDTNPNSTNLNDPIGNLIRGWYRWCGGVSAGGCYLDDASHVYVPPPPTPGWTGHDELYKTIPRLYCRTCHVAQGSTSSSFPDWTQFSVFTAGRLSYPVCVVRSMPHAEVPFKAFWLSTDPHGPAYLADGATGVNITGGCPP